MRHVTELRSFLGLRLQKLESDVMEAQTRTGTRLDQLGSDLRSAVEVPQTRLRYISANSRTAWRSEWVAEDQSPLLEVARAPDFLRCQAAYEASVRRARLILTHR